MPEAAHPFAELIGLTLESDGSGAGIARVTVSTMHLNPHGVAHGAVAYALADTAMGAALYPTLEEGRSCATIEIKITYFRPVVKGELTCRAMLDNKSRRTAHLTAHLEQGGKPVALATGNFAILDAVLESRSS